MQVTAIELDWLLSLNDSVLEEWLRGLDPTAARDILVQMDRRKAERTADLSMMPMTPTTRQADFLSLDCDERLYGGSVGGGKSQALLMWLAEGIGVPGYSGVVFRRIEADLFTSGDSLVMKAMQLYPPLGGMCTDKGLTWRFPSGALIELKGLQHDTSVTKFQGPSFHRAGFDELTHFTEAQYEYIVLQRIRGPVDFPVKMGAAATANPGSSGHLWVRQRFITQEAMNAIKGLDPSQPIPRGLVFYADKERSRAFVPARLADNPHLDRASYTKRLSRISSPVMRARMLNGDWSVMEDALLRAEWIRHYTHTAQHMDFYGADDKKFFMAHDNHMRRIVTCDTRGSSKQIKDDAKGRFSWTVIQVWDMTYGPQGKSFMALRHVRRERFSFPEAREELRRINREWQPMKIIVENASQGPDLWAELHSEMTIELAQPTTDKAVRAIPLQNMMEEGRVFLPREEGEWKPALEAEWLSWEGKDDQPNDQIDAAAYAAIEAQTFGVGGGAVDFDVRMGTLGVGVH